MADIPRPISGNRRQPSRLQRRAPPPASLQINPVPGWNVAIPLLSPLVSPDQAAEARSQNHNSHQQQKLDLPRHHAADMSSSSSSSAASAASASSVFKKWQHPAAPFCYEPAPPVRPFVPV